MFDVIEVVLMSLLLIMKKFRTFSSVSIVNFEQVNDGWIRNTNRYLILKFYFGEYELTSLML